MPMKPARFNTPEYRAWCHLRSRCSNPREKNYADYGGRGIKVCERWNSYENFLEDMGPRPEGMTLDRIDTNGNYEPSNCRWADRFVQNNNRRNNTKLTFIGETLTLSEWARKLGVNRSRLSMRYYVYNWTVEQTLKGKTR